VIAGVGSLFHKGIPTVAAALLGDVDVDVKVDPPILLVVHDGFLIGEDSTVPRPEIVVEQVITLKGCHSLRTRIVVQVIRLVFAFRLHPVRVEASADNLNRDKPLFLAQSRDLLPLKPTAFGRGDSLRKQGRGEGKEREEDPNTPVRRREVFHHIGSQKGREGRGRGIRQGLLDATWASHDVVNRHQTVHEGGRDNITDSV